MTNNLSVYIHIPFCLSKCAYCAFYSLIGTDKLKDGYTKALIDEISAFATDKDVITVYLGGGTPPAIGMDNLQKIISAVKSSFNLADNCEFTCEVNPGSVSIDDLISLRNAGVNRLSIGVQSLCDSELILIGRKHTASDALQCIKNARQAGFDNISADLMFGLPTQTLQTLMSSLAVADTADHVSIYSLQIEEGTRFYKNRDKYTFPTEALEGEQYRLICSYLSDKGYEHYEVSSFAKPGRRSLHNSVYWQRGEYIGFGAAAHSFYGGRRFYHADDLAGYISGAEPICEPPLDSAAVREETIMLSLRMSDGLPIEMIDAAKAARYVSFGLAEIKNGRFALTEQGFRVSNAIIAELI